MPCLQLLSAPDHQKFNWCLSVNGNKSNKSICYFYCDGGGLSVAAGLCWAKGTLELLFDRSHIFIVILPTVIVESGERNPSTFYIESNKNINGITRNGLEMFILPQTGAETSQERCRAAYRQQQSRLVGCLCIQPQVNLHTNRLLSLDSKPKAMQFSSTLETPAQRQHLPHMFNKGRFERRVKRWQTEKEKAADGDETEKLQPLCFWNRGEGKVVIGRTGTICLGGQSDTLV